MSDTPRTDGFLNETSEQFHDTAWIEHSQQLERELNSANERIKRLEEELMESKNKYSALVADVVHYRT